MTNLSSVMLSEQMKFSEFQAYLIAAKYMSTNEVFQQIEELKEKTKTFCFISKDIQTSILMKVTFDILQLSC